VPEPATLHDRIRRIESGTSFTVSPGGEVATHRYFNPVFRPRPVRDAADAARRYAEIADALRDSVAKHMRADVSVVRVPVRWRRLDGDRGTGQTAQSGP